MKAWNRSRISAWSADVLDRLDRVVESGDLAHVAERVEVVLQALEVVVETQAPDVDHGDLVVRHGARLGLAGASRRDEQVSDLRVGVPVAQVGAVEPDAAVTQRGRQDEGVGSGLGEDRLAPHGQSIQPDPAHDWPPHAITLSEERARRKRFHEPLQASLDGCSTPPPDVRPRKRSCDRARGSRGARGRRA